MFESGAEVADEESFEVLDTQQFREAYSEFAEVIHFIQLVESGLITITMTEYFQLPSTFPVVWNLYKAEVAKKARRANAHARAMYGPQ